MNRIPHVGRMAAATAAAMLGLAVFAAPARSAPVGIDATGDVFAAWNVWDGTRNVVQAATKPVGQAWSAPATLSGPGTDGLYLSLAVNARGDAAVAYTISPYSGSQSGTWA